MVCCDSSLYGHVSYSGGSVRIVVKFVRTYVINTVVYYGVKCE